MIDGIFKRLTPQNVEALRATSPEENQGGNEVDVEELRTALTSVTSELEIAHTSLQKLYEEARYVYSRLTHMEKSILAKESVTANKTDDDDEGGSGTNGGAVIEKQLFVDPSNHQNNDKLAKIQEAKALTQGLLNSIEALSAKAKQASSISPNNNSTQLGIK